MSSIIRMRNGVIGGLLRKLPAGTAPALGSYPQQSCPTMSRLYGEAVPSNGSLQALVDLYKRRKTLPEPPADAAQSPESRPGRLISYVDFHRKSPDRLMCWPKPIRSSGSGEGNLTSQALNCSSIPIGVEQTVDRRHDVFAFNVRNPRIAKRCDPHREFRRILRRRYRLPRPLKCLGIHPGSYAASPHAADWVTGRLAISDAAPRAS